MITTQHKFGKVRMILTDSPVYPSESLVGIGLTEQEAYENLMSFFPYKPYGEAHRQLFEYPKYAIVSHSKSRKRRKPSQTA